MKRIISLLMLSALLISLVACGGGEESSLPEAESSVPEESEAVSKPWYDTSVPDNYVSEIPEDHTSDESSDTDVSIIPDSSTPDTSFSEDPIGGTASGNGYNDLSSINGYNFARSASGYRIAYTKESALNATECVTNIVLGITAIYDGSVTRFFDAVNGTYYYAASGRYLYPCYEGSFLAGDLNGFNSDYSVTFTRGKDGYNENEVTVTLNDHAGHGIEYNYTAIYAEFDKKIYAYDQELYRVIGAISCRYYAASGSLLEGYDVETSFSVDEAKLGKYGVASNEGIIIPFEYDMIVTGQNSEGDSGVYLAIKDGRSYYFSSDGTNLTPDGFDCGSQPFGNRAWVFEDGQGYILEFN